MTLGPDNYIISNLEMSREYIKEKKKLRFTVHLEGTDVP